MSDTLWQKIGRRLGLLDGRAWSAFVGRESYAGKTVTTETAMQLSAVWACVRATSQALSCMPLKLFRKTGNDSREEIASHDLAALLSDPNEDQTPLEFWEAMTANLLVAGNAYAHIRRLGRRVDRLLFLPSSCVEPRREPASDVLTYRVHDRGKVETIGRDEILHLRGFGMDRDCGLSAIRFGVQTMGAAIAADEVAGRFYSQGMQTSGILSSDQILKKDQREQLQEIMTKFAGSRNAGKMMILEAGLKHAALSLNPEDAQLLETRRFHVEDICRWFGVPPIVIGHAAQGVTQWGSGIEQIMIAWLTLGIDPLADRIEARIKKQLLTDVDRRSGLYAEFNREALLQMDSTAKASFLSQMVNNGLMSRNEGRAKLNLPSKPGGDVLTVQSAMVPLDKIGQADDAPVAPPAEPRPEQARGVLH